MKNSQKGFVIPLLLGIIALLVISGGAYIYLNHPKTQQSFINEENVESVPALRNFNESSSSTPNGWIVYNAPSDGFSIFFPKSPGFELDTYKSAKGISYQVHDYHVDEGARILGIVKFIPEEPIDVSDPDNLLKQFLNEQLSITESNLINFSYTNYKSYRALDFTARNASVADIRGRLLLVNQTIYLFAILYPTADINQFVNSFELK